MKHDELCPQRQNVDVCLCALIMKVRLDECQRVLTISQRKQNEKKLAVKKPNMWPHSQWRGKHGWC